MLEKLKDEIVIDNYYERISKLIVQSKKRVKHNVNTEMVELYYEIGHIITELIEKYQLVSSQNQIIKSFSKKLTKQFGKGFKISNLKAMKKFYLTYKSSGHTLCDQSGENGTRLWNQLSWSHNRLIMNIEDETKRNFYLKECINSNWGVRQLERQINSFYYESLISTSDKYKKEVK
ncbi:MAG: DUF1016 N-terminal domain-containing protein [Bacilli bacterium]